MVKSSYCVFYYIGIFIFQCRQNFSILSWARSSVRLERSTDRTFFGVPKKLHQKGTGNRKVVSSNLIGPIFFFRSSVLCFESCCFTSENLLETKLKDEWYSGLFGCPEFWALLQSNMKPERKQIKQLWAPSKPVLPILEFYPNSKTKSRDV